MLALVRIPENQVELQNIPAPVIAAPDQARVRIKWAAVCTTDLAIVSGVFGGTTPRILGHEVAGEVIEIGQAVKGVSVGDFVALQPTIYCGICPPCLQYHWHLCQNRRFVGLDVDGGFAEEMVVPAVNLVPVPQSLPLQYACLVEPLACVIHAVDRLARYPRRGVIITGAGTSAFFFAKVLLAGGLPPNRILVSGRRDQRLAIIRDLGAHTVDVRTESLGAKSAEVFGADAPALLIDQTGDPDLLRDAMNMITPGGMLFIYDFTGHEMPFHFGMMQLREITIKTSTGCPNTIARALKLLEQGMEVSPVITHIYSPARMKSAYDILKTRDATHVKSVIQF